jgi:hypothetical protein
LAPLAKHPDQHRPEGAILLAVDQKLGEGPGPWVPPELADPVGAIEVGQHQHVEKLGTGTGPSASGAFEIARLARSGLAYVMALWWRTV